MSLVGSLLSQLPVHFKRSVHTDYFVSKNAFFVIYIRAHTWARRYENFLRADIKFKAKVEVSRRFMLMPWTIDLSIGYCPYSRVTRVSINFNCTGKSCHRLSNYWNSWDNWSWILSISWIHSDNRYRVLPTTWNCQVICFWRPSIN